MFELLFPEGSISISAPPQKHIQLYLANLRSCSRHRKLFSSLAQIQRLKGQQKSNIIYGPFLCVCVCFTYLFAPPLLPHCTNGVPAVLGHRAQGADEPPVGAAVVLQRAAVLLTQGAARRGSCVCEGAGSLLRGRS